MAFAVFVEMLNLRGQAVASCVESVVSPKPLRIDTIPAPTHPSPNVPIHVESVGYNPLARFPWISRRVCFHQPYLNLTSELGIESQRRHYDRELSCRQLRLRNADDSACHQSSPHRSSRLPSRRKV